MTLPVPCHVCARLLNAKVSVDPCEGEGKCRRCPLRNCRCTHAAPCDKGFIEAEHPNDGYQLALRRCPQCALASFEAGQRQAAS